MPDNRILWKLRRVGNQYQLTSFLILRLLGFVCTIAFFVANPGRLSKHRARDEPDFESPTHECLL